MVLDHPVATLVAARLLVRQKREYDVAWRLAPGAQPVTYDG